MNQPENLEKESLNIGRPRLRSSRPTPPEDEKDGRRPESSTTEAETTAGPRRN
jgi:hypothetical protein